MNQSVPGAIAAEGRASARGALVPWIFHQMAPAPSAASDGQAVTWPNLEAPESSRHQLEFAAGLLQDQTPTEIRPDAHFAGGAELVTLLFLKVVSIEFAGSA